MGVVRRNYVQNLKRLSVYTEFSTVMSQFVKRKKIVYEHNCLIDL